MCTASFEKSRTQLILGTDGANNEVEDTDDWEN